MDWTSKSALRWDCDAKGCMNINGRPKLMAFDDCFPGRIRPSDIDFVVEINGFFLFAEWKGPSVPLTIAQEILHKKLTEKSPTILSVIVEGNAKTMAINGLRCIRRGVVGKWEPSSLDDFRRRCREWASWVSTRQAKRLAG